ncbi:MAG: glyoxalase/bleomycin resistance/extradiol dioxygenase family protein [Pseudomonadota bacterium]
MKPVPYLFFNGDCRAALAFYAELFGTEPDVMEASGMPEDVPVPDDKKDWVMHASLTIGEGMLMASDNIFGESDKMSGCGIQLDLPTAEAGKALFDRLAEGGEITMPWEPTFWSAGFGTCTDRFGTQWMIGTSEMTG